MWLGIGLAGLVVGFGLLMLSDSKPPRSKPPVIAASDQSSREFASAHSLLRKPGFSASSHADKLAVLLDAIGRESDASARGEKLEVFFDTAAHDFPAAVELVHSHPLEAIRKLETGLIVRWAASSLDEAINWARGIPDSEQKHETLLTLAGEAVRSNPALALQLADEIPSNLKKEDLISRALADWAATDPKAAAARVLAIQPGDNRNEAVLRVTTVWAESDPSSAGAFAVEQMSPGKTQDDAVIGIIQRWTQQDPEQAAAWLEAFPTGALRDTAVTELVKLWADKDSKGLSGWLKELPKGTEQDLALSAYVLKLASQHPEQAVESAKAITADAVRTQNLESIGESWLSTDPSAAKAWISQSELPEITKTRLLSRQSISSNP
jgi:hypothetical protein